MKVTRLSTAGLLLLASFFTTSALTAKPASSISEVIGPAEARAVSRVDYQQQVELDCDTGSACYGKFVHLTSKQTLEIDHSICYVSYDSAIYVDEVYFYYQQGSDDFYYDLGAQRTSYDGSGAYVGIYAQDGPFIVPKGKRLNIEIRASDSLGSAYCSIFGQRVTYP